jgi:predicted lipid-binding transport protein (Tim44 family)
MDGWMGGWMDGWMGGWMDGLMDGWMYGWMDGWMYVWIVCNAVFNEASPIIARITMLSCKFTTCLGHKEPSSGKHNLHKFLYCTVMA